MLDGSQTESTRTPGLLQIVEGHEVNRYSKSQPIEPWLTLPARRGLHELGQKVSEPWSMTFACQGRESSPCFTLVYGTTEQLKPLCSQWGARPLLSISEERSSLLTSYLAVKRLLIDTGIAATVVAVTERESALGAPVQRPSQLLTECTRDYLQVDLEVITLQWTDMHWPGSLAFNAMVDSWVEESVTLSHLRWIPMSIHATPVPTSLGARIN